MGSVFRLFWVLRFFNVARRKKSTMIFSPVVFLLRRQPSPILEAHKCAFLGVPSCVWCHTSEGFDPRLGRLRHAEGQTSHPSQQGCDYPVSLLGLPSWVGDGTYAFCPGICSTMHPHDPDEGEDKVFIPKTLHSMTQDDFFVLCPQFGPCQDPNSRTAKKYANLQNNLRKFKMTRWYENAKWLKVCGISIFLSEDLVLKILVPYGAKNSRITFGCSVRNIILFPPAL